MTDSLYTPKWVGVQQLQAEVGLTDSTIETLVQEDASFKRVHDGTVEYDLRKVYNHPAVQAFRANVGSGVATSISYEKIIREDLLRNQKS